MSSARQSRRKAFFAAHPHCIFCGGTYPASEFDEVPPRALFQGRVWPEGYRFPACVSCNNGSHKADEFLTFLALCAEDPTNDNDLAARHKTIRSIARARGLGKELIASARDVRNACNRYGLKLSPGMTTADVPALTLSGPRAKTLLSTSATKLACALHYKHAGKAIPSHGGILFYLVTNAEILGRGPLDLEAIPFNRVNPSRGSQVLTDRFEYLWSVSDDKSLGLYAVRFEQSFSMVIAVSTDDPDHLLDLGGSIMSPFVHGQARQGPPLRRRDAA